MELIYTKTKMNSSEEILQEKNVWKLPKGHIYYPLVVASTIVFRHFWYFWIVNQPKITLVYLRNRKTVPIICWDFGLLLCIISGATPDYICGSVWAIPTHRVYWLDDTGTHAITDTIQMLDCSFIISNVTIMIYIYKYVWCHNHGIMWLICMIIYMYT